MAQEGQEQEEEPKDTPSDVATEEELSLPSSLLPSNRNTPSPASPDQSGNPSTPSSGHSRDPSPSAFTTPAAEPITGPSKLTLAQARGVHISNLRVKMFKRSPSPESDYSPEYLDATHAGSASGDDWSTDLSNTTAFHFPAAALTPSPRARSLSPQVEPPDADITIRPDRPSSAPSSAGLQPLDLTYPQALDLRSPRNSPATTPSDLRPPGHASTPPPLPTTNDPPTSPYAVAQAAASAHPADRNPPPRRRRDKKTAYPVGNPHQTRSQSKHAASMRTYLAILNDEARQPTHGPQSPVFSPQDLLDAGVLLEGTDVSSVPDQPGPSGDPQQ